MPGAWTTGRVEAFSDGIFSIAATLLVLELRVPDLAGSASEGDLTSALWDAWPRLLTFAVSFAVIAMYWLGHYSMMHWLERGDEAACRRGHHWVWRRHVGGAHLAAALNSVFRRADRLLADADAPRYARAGRTRRP